MVDHLRDKESIKRDSKCTARGPDLSVYFTDASCEFHLLQYNDSTSDGVAAMATLTCPSLPVFSREVSTVFTSILVGCIYITREKLSVLHTAKCSYRSYIWSHKLNC